MHRLLAAVAMVVVATAAAASGVAAQNLPLPELPYAYDALAPWIDEATMRVHHLKHHRGYTDRLNDVLAQMRADPQHNALAKLGVDALLGRLAALPTHYATPLRNFGGGYVNHAFFWKCLAPAEPAAPAAAVTAEAADGSATTPDPAAAAAAALAATPVRRPTGALAAAIDATYGSFEQFQAAFAQTAAGVFGSGWAWLVLTDADNVVRTAMDKRGGKPRPALPLGWG